MISQKLKVNKVPVKTVKSKKLVNYLLSVPGFGNISNPPSLKFSDSDGGSGTTLGDVVSGFANLTFLIAGFLALYWFCWGVFQYIVAQGDKEKLAKARSRMTWSIIGFIFLVVSFFISQYFSGIFKPVQPSVTEITNPGTIK